VKIRTGRGETVTSKRLAKKLRRAPENFYVNVHNSEHPDGAIRGQLGLAL
jgi:CHRD domain